MRQAAFLLAAAVLGTACGGGAEKKAEAPGQLTRHDTEITHDPCDLTASGAEQIDANGDKRSDVTIVKSGEREVCRAVDLNFDGLIDRYTYLDDQGRVRRQESDYDRDGRFDEITIFKNGVLAERQRATTLDLRLDTWQFFENGSLARTERDANGDGIVDQWWEYKSPECPLIHADVNGDGRPDPGASVDYCKETGYVPPERAEAAKAKSPTFEAAGDRGVDIVDTRPQGEGEKPKDGEKPADSGAGDKASEGSK